MKIQHIPSNNLIRIKYESVEEKKEVFKHLQRLSEQFASAEVEVVK